MKKLLGLVALASGILASMETFAADKKVVVCHDKAGFTHKFTLEKFIKKSEYLKYTSFSGGIYLAGYTKFGPRLSEGSEPLPVLVELGESPTRCLFAGLNFSAVIDENTSFQASGHACSQPTKNLSGSITTLVSQQDPSFKAVVETPIVCK